MPCNLAQATTSAVLSRYSPWQAVWLRMTRLAVHPLHRTQLLATDALPVVMTSGMHLLRVVMASRRSGEKPVQSLATALCLGRSAACCLDNAAPLQRQEPLARGKNECISWRRGNAAMAFSGDRPLMTSDKKQAPGRSPGLDADVATQAAAGAWRTSDHGGDS